ncbi:MAG: hypothetical protein ACTHQM_02815 [Thermoanaerobaculia bacterium]
MQIVCVLFPEFTQLDLTGPYEVFHRLPRTEVALGPEGGDGGGLVIAKGTPEQIAQVKSSPTGVYLAKTLKDSAKRAMVLT